MGKTSVRILDSVVSKIKSLNNGAFGTLLTSTEGIDGSLDILGLVVTNAGGEDNTPIDDLAELHTPGGLVYLASFAVTADEIVELDNTVIVKYNPETNVLSVTHEQHDDVEIKTITASNIAEDYFMVRTRVVLPFSTEMTETGVHEAIEDCSKRLDEVELSELREVSHNRSLDKPDKKKKYSSLSDIEIMEFTPLLRANPGDDDEKAKGVMFDYKKRQAKCCWLDLQLDTLTLCPWNEPASYIPDMVGLSLRQYLTLFENSLVGQISQPDSLSVPEVFHFLPDGLGHFVSAVYPKKKLDRDLGDFRGYLHQAFALPTDRPLFMRGNAFSFTEEQKGKELICPHQNAGASGIEGGDPALVLGRYAYHHYCQQGMSDDGWGCAYRSLQTLCSWFKLQGYTNRSVPTIREIQQCLVDIGDKPSNFLGSSQWIGSTEVGFCLDTLLGVASRFASVSSGDEMSMKGGELTHHFKTQGTPVMIGGANLAHTILGVDYNRKTGDIKFLILDPHYTGGEDINVIISKGWCGWKGLNFWKKGCFYNMCMPIRPKCV